MLYAPIFFVLTTGFWEIPPYRVLVLGMAPAPEQRVVLGLPLIVLYSSPSASVSIFTGCEGYILRKGCVWAAEFIAVRWYLHC